MLFAPAGAGSGASVANNLSPGDKPFGLRGRGRKALQDV